MGEQVPDPDMRAVRGRIFPATHLGDVFLGEVVERELAGIAERQDRQRREGLGHRSDAEQRVGGDRALLRQVLHAEAADMDEAPFRDQSIDQARRGRVALESLELAVDRVEPGLERRFRRLRGGRHGEAA
jgi:hypothetical protein